MLSYEHCLFGGGAEPMSITWTVSESESESEYVGYQIKTKSIYVQNVAKCSEKKSIRMFTEVPHKFKIL